MIMTSEPAFCHISLLLISFVVSKGSDVQLTEIRRNEELSDNGIDLCSWFAGSSVE